MTDSCYIFGLALDGKGGASDVKSTATDSAQPTWLHIDYSAADTYPWLNSQHVDELTIEALTRSETRPRSMIKSDGLLIVLRGVNMNPDAEPEDMVSIRIWLQEQRMITVRQRRILAAQDVKSTLEAGKGPSSLIHVLIDIITQLADRIADFVNQMEARMDQYEAAIGQQNPIALRSQISELRRQSAVVRRFLAPQRDALDTLQQPSNKNFSDSHRYAIREETDRMIRSVEDLDLVRERALVAQEELINLAAQEQNNRMYVLSIIAAVFLPITFISGVFGMNVAGLPGTNTPAAFLIVCIAMIVLSIGTLLWLRFKGWF